MDTNKLNIKILRITSPAQLINTEKEHRGENEKELYPWAFGTQFKEVAEDVIPDKSEKDLEESLKKHPIFYVITKHRPSLGIKELSRMGREYFEEDKMKNGLDILAMSVSIETNKLILKTLVRAYSQEYVPDMAPFFMITKDDVVEQEVVQEKKSGVLLVPDEIKNFKYTDEEVKAHKQKLKKQNELYDKATNEVPFLNAINEYVPKKMPTPEDTTPLIYNLKEKNQVETVTSNTIFEKIYRELITYVSGVEYYHYVSVMDGKEPETTFMDYLEEYINRIYVMDNGARSGGLKLESEDIPLMLDRLYKALFQLYIVQDLIDDPMVTDIKITGPDSIRARVKGKAYLSNIHFVDERDYKRFINGVAIRNKISLDVPTQTFTDSKDGDYLLRFTIKSGYITSTGCPSLHIRKISRKKLLDKELIAAGMFDEKVRDYLLDCGKNSRGVVFAGPPGSGKTIALNWFLECAYEDSAEILVIQENDELFTNRKGVMIEHVVMNPERGREKVTLEDLGQMALVAGANVFIIGEAKGAEICSAITLSNSGCRTAITIHSQSAAETPDKMADLAMRGYSQDYTQAKRMLKSFQTIVYLQDFGVREIVEITGFDENKKDLIYKHIYRREEE